jgi:hypothetical protein
VTAYLGRRLVERERALTQGDTVAPSPAAELPRSAVADLADGPAGRRFSGGDVAFMTVLGMMVGAALLYAAILLRARGIDVLSILPRP